MTQEKRGVTPEKRGVAPEKKNVMMLPCMTFLERALTIYASWQILILIGISFCGLVLSAK